MKPERLPSGSYRIRYTDPWGQRRTGATTGSPAPAISGRGGGRRTGGTWTGTFCQCWARYRVGRLSAEDIDRYLTGFAQRPPDGRPAKGLAHSPGASQPDPQKRTGGKSRPLAPSTVHRHYRTIHRALAVAVDRGLIAKNPADKVQPPKVPKREVTVLSVEQIDALADAISPRYRAWVFVAAYGGLRWSETVRSDDG